MTARPRASGHLVVYAPIGTLLAAPPIPAGAGIVGEVGADGNLRVWFSGPPAAGAENATWAGRVGTAADELLAGRDPAVIAPDLLLRVGDYDIARGLVTLDGPGAEGPVARWCGRAAFDPRDLVSYRLPDLLRRRFVEALEAGERDLIRRARATAQLGGVDLPEPVELGLRLPE